MIKSKATTHRSNLAVPSMQDRSMGMTGLVVCSTCASFLSDRGGSTTCVAIVYTLSLVVAKYGASGGNVSESTGVPGTDE
jgi:hypothetical protein